MINIHHRLEAYSQSTLSPSSSSTSSDTKQSSGDENVEKEAKLYFRYQCSHPGGGLYAPYDDVRLLLQVKSDTYCI